jgi:hypothetical protein
MSPLRQVLCTGDCLEFVFAIYFVFDSLVFLRIEFTSIEKIIIIIIIYIIITTITTSSGCSALRTTTRHIILRTFDFA